LNTISRPVTLQSSLIEKHIFQKNHESNNCPLNGILRLIVIFNTLIRSYYVILFTDHYFGISTIKTNNLVGSNSNPNGQADDGNQSIKIQQKKPSTPLDLPINHIYQI